MQRIATRWLRSCFLAHTPLIGRVAIGADYGQPIDSATER
jgi:hypothetical protein